MSIRNVQQRLRSGVWWVVGGRTLGIGITFLLNALLARILGPSGFGGFVLAATLTAVFSLVGMLGFNEAFVRFISERLAHKNARGAARVVVKGLVISGICLSVGGPLAWLGLTRVDLGLSAVGEVRTLGWLIVAAAALLAFQQLGAESLRGFHQLRLASLFAGGQMGGLFSSVVFLALVVVGTSLVRPAPSLTQVLVWLLAALAVTLPFTYVSLWRTARAAVHAHAAARREPHVPSTRQMLSVGGAIMIIHTLAFVTQQADLWIAGAYCASEDVGLYGSARRLTLLAAMPVQIAMLAVISSIADLHVRGKRRHLQAMLRGTAMLAAVPALIALAPLIANPGGMLSLVFGQEYRAAESLLVILALGYVPLILCGNPVHALTMTGSHRVAMTVNLATTCLLLALGPLVVQRWGIEGLAILSSGTLALQNVSLWLCARIKCGIWTHIGSALPILRAGRRDGDLDAAAPPHPLPNGAPVRGEKLLVPPRVWSGRPAAPRSLPQQSAQRKRLDGIWWLNPELVFAALVGGAALAAAWLAPETYRQYGSEKYFTGFYLTLSFFAIAAFAIGSWTARASRAVPRTTPPHVEAGLGRWFVAAAVLGLAGYAVWFTVAVRNGLTLSSLSQFTNLANEEVADYVKESAMQTVAGITTATQFGIAAFMLGTWLWLRGQRWVAPVMTVLVVATLLRVVLNSERLALLEIAVPAAIVVVRVYVMERRWGPWTRRAVYLAPALAVLTLLVTFAATEFGRSWRYYRSDFNSIAEFTVWRVTGYYTTALNNGAMEYEARGVRPLPYECLHAFWAFPLVEQSALSYPSLTGVDPVNARLATLERFGNPEFNNTSGLLQPLVDFGPAGFVIVWLFYGWLAGRLYRSFLAGSLAGVAFYPLVFLSLLEVPRILYLPSGRLFPAVAFLALLVLACRSGVVRRVTAPRPGTLRQRGVAALESGW